MDDTPPHRPEPDAAAPPASFVTQAALLALLVGLFCWALMMPLPFRGRMGTAVGNLLHAPAFAVLAFCTHRVARLRSRTRESLSSGLFTAFLVWLAVVLFGAATEVAQGYVGRGTSWDDAINDALGAAAGVLISLTQERCAWPLKLTGVFLGVGILLWAEFDSLSAIVELSRQRDEMPLLASFERKWDLDAWTPEAARLRRETIHATHGRCALRVDLKPAQYSGLHIYDPPADWSAYQELAFDIFVEPADGNAAAPLELIVKIQDADHNGNYDDRFHRMRKLPPGPQTVRIPLADTAKLESGRSLDLAKINMLQFFTINLETPRTFYLDNIRLR